MKTIPSNAKCRLLRLAGTSLLVVYGSVVSAQVELPSAPPATVYKLQTVRKVASTFAPLKILIGLNKSEEVKLLPAVQRSLGKVKFASKVDDPTTFVSLDLVHGGFAFSKSLKQFEGDYPTLLPSTEPADRPEAQVVAEKYLTDNGLMPPTTQTDQMVLAKVDTVSAARPNKLVGVPINANDISPVVVIDKLRVVTFRRIINGLQVVGPGSKIVVTIGDKLDATTGGKVFDVVSVIKRWAPFTAPAATRAISGKAAAAAQAAVISPTAALEQLQTRINEAFGPAVAAKSVVKTADTALYDGNDKVIQPVYVFEVEVGQQPVVGVSPPTPFPGNDSQDQFLGIIPALSKVPEPIYQLNDSPSSRIPLLKSGPDEIQ